MNTKSTSTIAGQVFQRAFEEIPTVLLPFDPTWANGTGYYDYAVKKVRLAVGELAKSVDDENRRIIFIGTRFGTVVIFDRFSDQTNAGVYVANYPKETIFKYLVGTSSITDEAMVNIFGFDNLGQVIEKIAKDFEPKQDIVKQLPLEG